MLGLIFEHRIHVQRVVMDRGRPVFQDLYENFDDARGVYTIQMQVRNPLLGFLFGYRG
ncbi:hypothetical protein QFZ36_000344 [Pseudarthrobacter siccitolerans]|uniref:Uncharacterized protein n=1 Tax=Pseudarthrobacter siccitolerans TaxID=861266 RepID=A0ABU0PFP2_9MICC|nr:hypothetical protein [Pseudarthrobacter siccitolerans]MDQ0672783.1 hypothetical protein [Pseudarthrobacter siccitolerans]